jgi:hypothetical protein
MTLSTGCKSQPNFDTFVKTELFITISLTLLFPLNILYPAVNIVAGILIIEKLQELNAPVPKYVTVFGNIIGFNKGENENE